jgi:hypothetical protein
MSFVSIVGRWNFICVMSDGQVTGENGEILQEDYQKFQLIGEKQFVAYAGNKDWCERAAEIAKNYYRLGLDLHSVAETIQEILIRDIPYAKYGQVVNMAIGGVSKRETIEFYALSNKNTSVDQIQPNKPGVDDVALGYCTSTKLPEEWDWNALTNVMIPFLRQNGIDTPEQIQKSQKQLNEFIANLDPTVNNHTFALAISLDR